MKKLTTTRRIQPRTLVRIYKKGFGYSKLTVIENIDHYFSAFAEDEFFNIVKDGETVEAYIWIENEASYEFNLRIIGRIIPGPKILFFEHTDNISRNEIRKCLTAEVSIPIKFFIFDTGENNKAISAESITLRKGSVILISDREVAVKSPIKLKEGSYLKGHIDIQGEDVEIVGKIEIINDEKKIYNIIFSGMSEKIRIKILDYIFTIYRER